MNIIRTENLIKRYDQDDILKGITIGFKQGTITSIIGPSGSGKSTFLRCLNQLEEASNGAVFFHEDNIVDRSININQVRSKIGMVFQSFNLFDNMTVLRNITIGQEKILHRNKEESQERAIYYLNKVGLAAFRDRQVASLSGGQKQRVAIARTLAMDPEILLFDEPTSSLDPLMVGEVLDVIKDVVKEDFTVIVVTHEMDFAKDISDRVLFMEDGTIVVDATSEDVFTNPTHPRLRAYLKRFL